jgi:hypothetical protein
MLGLIVPRRGVWAGHLQDDSTGGKECTRGSIVELTTVVTLDGFDGATKLRVNKDGFFDNVEKVLDFTCKGKVHTK